LGLNLLAARFGVSLAASSRLFFAITCRLDRRRIQNGAARDARAEIKQPSPACEIRLP
jgi:hypothetical protein